MLNTAPLIAAFLTSPGSECAERLRQNSPGCVCLWSSALKHVNSSCREFYQCQRRFHNPMAGFLLTQSDLVVTAQHGWSCSIPAHRAWRCWQSAQSTNGGKNPSSAGCDEVSAILLRWKPTGICAWKPVVARWLPALGTRCPNSRTPRAVLPSTSTNS